MTSGLRVARCGSALLAAALAVVVLPGCNRVAPGSAPTAPATRGTSTPATDSSAEPSPSDTGDPASPTETASPSSTASPSGSPSPTATSTVPVTCNTVTPVRLGRSTADARRTTEVVTVLSDGRNLTTGSAEQTEFHAPTIRGPLGTEISDPATMALVATLIEDSTRNRVLLERPETPAARADISRRPYDSPGTYALYNASSPLSADLVVVCGGQEQRWTFSGEANPSTGVVNCAVEPSRSNIVARLVYQTNC